MRELILVIGLAGGFVTGWNLCFYKQRARYRELNARFIKLRNQTMRVPPVKRRDADWRFTDHGHYNGPAS